MEDLVIYSHRLTRLLYTASAFSLILAICAGYLYQKATAPKLFAENYHAYQLPTFRAASNQSVIKDDYQNGKMDAVIADFAAMDSKQPEDYVLAGSAFLEKNQPAKAVETFKKLISQNGATKSDAFQEDAEYYLGMALLANNQPAKALPLFENIAADSENSYHAVISRRFIWMVKISVARY